MIKVISLLFLVLALACGSGDQDSQSDMAADHTEETAPLKQPAPLEDGAVELATRNVSCGCALEEVGHCGNYIEIESRYVEIANWEALGLGEMEWCGKTGVRAESAGEIRDGRFVATTLDVNL